MQEVDLPHAVNVGRSRSWKRFWFVLKPSALVYYASRGDKEPILRLWLHEQTLVSLDETSRSFVLSSLWQRVSLRIAQQQEEPADGGGSPASTQPSRLGGAGGLSRMQSQIGSISSEGVAGSSMRKCVDVSKRVASAAQTVTRDYKKWVQALTVATQQAKVSLEQFSTM